MKNIYDLRVDQPVIFSANPAEFIVKEIRPKKETVLICIDGLPETQREVKIAHVYPATEHVKEVSKLVKEKRDFIKTIKPFGININDKIMNKSFLKCWINLCEAEKKPKTIGAIKADFDLFIDSIKDRISIINHLTIDGIPFIAPALPDLELD